MIRAGNQLLQAQRSLPRQNADIRHADNRQPVPALCPQGSAGAVRANCVGGLSRREISSEQTVGNNGGALRGHAFLIEGERAEPRPVLLAGIGDHRDQFASVAELAQLVQRKKRCAGKVCFHPQNPIKFDGVSDGFMNLEPKLRTVEDNREHAFRTLLRLVQCYCFFADAPGVLQQLEFVNQLVALVLPLSAVRSGVGPLLDIVSREGVSGVTGAGRVLGLMDVRALGRNEPLLLAPEVQVGFGQRDTGYGG